MIKSYQVLIAGKVQGVYYRASTRDQANALGVMGFVRNENDGSVYAEIEGDEEGVEKLIAWCKQGPQGAKVENVKVVEQSKKGYKGFEIRII